MASRRPFSPAFVFCVQTTTGAWFVAVDRLQPVALVLSTDGRHTALTGWADLVSVPTRTPLRPRRAGVVDGRVVVQDLPDGPSVVLTVDPSGVAQPSVEALPADRLRHPRLWAAPDRRSEPWAYTSILVNDYTWTSRVGHAGAADLALPASVLGFVPTEPIALACLLTADKRPWPFRRSTQLALMSVVDGRVAAQPVPNPDIAELCWPSRFHPRDSITALHEYLEYTLRQADSAAEFGLRDPEFVLRNTLDDPEIELRFRHPDFPDREFRRLDRPFNELGNLGEGLRELGISLSEDIQFGLLAHRVASVGSRIVYC
jgi:hypothetical protein